MLLPTDVPLPWRAVMRKDKLGDTSTIPEDQSNSLEDALGLTTPGERADVSWDMIEHAETRARVVLRMVPVLAPGRAHQIVGASVTAQLALPAPNQHELNQVAIKKVPVEEIQARSSLRWAQSSAGIAGMLGSADPNDVHLALIAKRWLELSSAGDPNPANTIAAEQGRSASTVRRWMAEVRSRGILSGETRRKPGPRPTYGTD